MASFKSIACGLYLGFITIGLTTAAVPSYATLIDNGLTTLDDATNLEWLDLTESTNRSFNDVSGEFGVGGDFAGFRHATTADITTLWTSQGFPPGFTQLPAPASFANFLTLFGATSGGAFPDIEGYFATTTGTGLGRLLQADGDGRFFALVDEGFDPTSFGTQTGNWLVRDAVSAVPEPAPLGVLALGIFGLAISRRYRIKKAT